LVFLFTARQSHVIKYCSIAAKLGLLSQHYHLPLWHTDTESDREAKVAGSTLTTVHFKKFFWCSALQHLKDYLLIMIRVIISLLFVSIFRLIQ